MPGIKISNTLENNIFGASFEIKEVNTRKITRRWEEQGGFGIIGQVTRLCALSLQHPYSLKGI